MINRILFTILFLFTTQQLLASSEYLTKSKGTDQEVIVSLLPSPGATVASDTKLEAVFSVELDTKHIKKNDIKLKRISPDVEKIRGSISYNANRKAVSFIPQDILPEGIYEIEYKSLKIVKANKDTKIKKIKYRFNVVPVVLESLSLSPDTLALKTGESHAVSILENYSDGSSEPVDTVEWIISNDAVVSIDTNGELTALSTGTSTLKAKVGSIESNEITIEVKPPVVLESLSVSHNPIILRVGTTTQIEVSGHYSDGTTQVVDEGLEYTIADTNIATIDGTDVIEAFTEGSTILVAHIGDIYSDTITLTVNKKIDTENFNFTNFGSRYTDQIPVDATKEAYDEKRFCMIAGQIFSEDGTPLSGVKVSIHKHNEYGSTVTDSNGTYTIPSEGGQQLTVRYIKQGYTTVDRKVDAPAQDWIRTPDVTMLEIDIKATQIDLNNNTPQIHVSTPVTDDRGERSTTLVFDGVSRATVTSPDGSERVLTNIAVRATEFKTPESMPSDLPTESAYTYCSDLQIDGVSDNEEVSFDAPVVMYVDNFLGFDVGEIVPVGYYDRNAGEWKASDNGVVVRLLDTNNDGLVDAVDSTGDDLPNDLDGDGSFEDEVAGLQNNPDYTEGKTYWRAEMMHFTPWDHNWPWGPPEDAQKPKQDDPKTDDDEPNDCKVAVSSYVSGKSRVFHEDIPIAGTNITLHYSSKRVDGYKHVIDASVYTTDLPSSIVGAKVTLSVAGKTYIKNPDLSELNDLQFIWDGKDVLGNSITGKITATIEVAYKYQLVYLRASSAFSQAWARAGAGSTNVIGREAVEFTDSKTIQLNVEAGVNNNSGIANGWTLSNVHDMGTNSIYKGDGTKVDKEIDLGNGLVAYYRFDGDAQDSSTQGNHAYASGINYVDGLRGKAANFDGNYDYVRLDPSMQTPYLGVSAWFNTTSNKSGYDNNLMLVRLRNYGYSISLNSAGVGKISGDVTINNASASYGFSSSQTYNDGKWHHIVMNYSEDGFQVYLDGTLLTEQNHHTNGPIYGGGGGYSIGRDGSHSSDYYEGLVDEFRIYNRALNENEVKGLYQNGVSGDATYNFDTFDVSDNELEYQFNLNGKHLSTKAYPSHIPLETYTYDSNGHVETIINQFGEVTTITRDGNGNPTQITAPNGQVTTLTVDEQGNLIEVGYEDNAKYTFTYFDGSLMDIMTDRNGNSIQHKFNDIGRIIEEIDGEGGSYRFLRNINDNETFYSTILPEGETSTSSDVVLANGDKQSTMTLATGETVTATFAKDEKSTSSLRDGVATVYTYTIDTLTHQKTLASKDTTQPSGLKQNTVYTTIYDGNETHTNTKTRTVTTNGKTTTFITDYNNGTSTITTPAGRTAASTYDINTLLVSQSSQGTLTPTTYTYDDKERVTKESRGSRETTYTYDSHGNVATVTNPRGEVTSYSYDIVDNLTSVTYPNGTSEHFSYDKNGNLLTRTVPTPTDHTFAYNGTDSRTNYTSPLNKVTTYTYDKSKNLTSITKPSGKAITNIYDKGRLVSTTTPEGTITYSYFFADKVGSISKGSENFSFTYDGTLVTSIVQSGLLNHTTDFTYNNDFQITSSTYAGETENYSYDDDGLITQSGAYSLTRDTQNAYVTTLTDGTLTQNRSYNNFGEITEVSDNTFTYELSQRDDAGAITQKRETLNGTTITYDYTFDEMGRLIEVKKDSVTVEQYSYDNNGNRATSIVNGVSASASYTLDDQLVVYGDNSYRYDEDGYLEEKVAPEGTTTYSYGTLGELREVITPTQTISYKHNALDQRVAKLVNGTVVEKYLWANLTTLLAVYDSNDNLVQRFEYADQRMPISMTSSGQKYYLHYDQVGSLRAVTDDSHNIVKEITYDTFGDILTDSNPTFKVPFGFAGGLYDQDTKLTRFGYRDYDAYTGKWTAKDPIDFQGGDSNLYGYVLGDPVNFVDPEGENPLLLIIPLYFLLGDDYANAPMTENDIYDGMTPMNELGLCLIGGPEWLAGKEYLWGSNGTRLAPWGNRTGHPTGKYPHYHRRPKLDSKGQVPRGQGINRHRPWDKLDDDKSFWDRF